MAFVINDSCVGCGACAADCVVSCISSKDDGKYIINSDECVECGACESVCPVGAISRG